MKIYTKTGDKGETSLFGGKRVKKYSLRVETYGTIDELNSSLGVAISFMDKQVYKDLKAKLNRIQNTLFNLGSIIASERTSGFISGDREIDIKSEDVKFLEDLIDKYDQSLEPLENFILPGGCKVASLLQFSRTIARRAERLIVKLSEVEEIHPEAIKYLNRLSDGLFTFSRIANMLEGVKEEKWH